MGLDMYLYRKTVSEAAYWRKANSIHGWFSNQKNGGLDNCENLTVTVDMLKALRDDCNAVLENHELAMELLPPTEGFFFGSNELNEWYFQDLKNTSEQLTKILNESDEDDLFEYHAWW